MKKLFFTMGAIGLFFTSTQAQVAETTTTTETEVTTQFAVQDEFAKVEVADLPEQVTAAITRDYAEATTKEVWVKEKDGKVVYKIKLDVNGEEKKLYADAEGNWIDKKDKKKDNNSDS